MFQRLTVTSNLDTTVVLFGVRSGHVSFGRNTVPAKSVSCLPLQQMTKKRMRNYYTIKHTKANNTVCNVSTNSTKIILAKYLHNIPPTRCSNLFLLK